MCISELVCMHTYSQQTPGSRLVGMEACLMAGGKPGAAVPLPPGTRRGSDNRPHNNLPMYTFLIYALIYTLEIIPPM